MPRIVFSEHIETSAEDVWDLISDVRRGPEWVTVMKEVLHVSEEPIKEGSTYRELSKVGPSTSETEWRITKFEAPKLQVHECREKALRAVLTMTIEPEGDGVRFTQKTEYKMMPDLRPFGWLLETLFAHRMIKKELGRTIKNAKSILESGSE